MPTHEANLDTSPRVRRKERTRQAILNAARELLHEHGHDKLSLRAIARNADYSPAGIYEYFSNKNDIIESLVEQSALDLAKRLRHSIIQSFVESSFAEPGGSLVAIGLAYLAYARENPEDFLLLFSRIDSSNQWHSNEINSLAPYRVVFEEVVQQIINRTLHMPSCKAEQISYGLWALAHGMAMLQLTNLAGYKADFATADRAALESYIRGLSTTT